MYLLPPLDFCWRWLIYSGNQFQKFQEFVAAAIQILFADAIFTEIAVLEVLYCPILWQTVLDSSPCAFYGVSASSVAGIEFHTMVHSRVNVSEVFQGRIGFPAITIDCSSGMDVPLNDGI